MTALAQLVAAHGFRVTVLGDRMFMAEKCVARGIRLLTIRWNRTQSVWTGKLQTLHRVVP